MNPYPRDEQGNPLPSKGEKICVAHLEERFPGRKFPKHKTLRWLTNPETGRHLELDCYNEELRLAVEYNGRQHYEFVPDMHESEEGLKYQQRLDAVSVLCTRWVGLPLIFQRVLALWLMIPPF
ncbi:uncharacterized protein LOC113238558 [Hyposmocoma kahamanoa]|uniref:uncharacterized protein LOC113238558 n=1 Tax=Hyposmocoma kahamanoa TaxID=1477025 RepID=UPI000E6D9791|nr:uncharacterized protein LOC113238558 [Hyposmocoma kahamanoa]XP_026331167.1 uncharacterized protein LOC113238558 [Hyposmocoma kahamanoa]